MTSHQIGGTVVVATGPFGASERIISLDRAMTIAEIIASHSLRFRLPTIAVMEGSPVLRGQWNVRMVRPGDVLGLIAIPRGGEDGGAKPIIGLVASIALAIAAPMIGGWAAGAFFGGSTVASSLVTGLVLAGGSLLLNSLFPPPSSAEDTAESVYSALTANNQATPLDIVPVLYGKLDFAPRFAARPYAEFAGNDQFLYQLFAVTLGKADITRIRIGETEAWNAVDGYSPSFSDLTFEIIQPGGAVTLFPANVITAPEVANLPVPDAPDVLGPFVANAPGTTVDRLAVDFAFPGGLFEYDSNGKIKTHSVSLKAEYRPINDAGAPIGGWTTLFAETFQKATRTPQRLSRSAEVAAGRYEVRFLSEAAFSSSDRVVSQCVWVGLRGYLTGFVTPPGCTLLAMKVRANEQISQAAASQVRVTAERYLETWNPGTQTWVEAKTRSIAWAAADALRNADYSIGLLDTQYDLGWLVEKDAVWAGRGDTFNGLFDRAQTLSDVVRTILRAGRSQPVRLGGKIGFTRLEPKLIKRAVFTPRNVVRGSFSHELVMFDEDKPDSVIGEFLDETVWDTREVTASLAAIGSDAPQRIEYFGITDHDQVWREAVTDAAVNAYQREFVGFVAEWEGKLLVRGDPILVHHPFIEGVTTAGLADRDGDILTIDQDFDTDPDAEHYIILRSKDGTEWGPCRIDNFENRDVALDSDDRALIEAQMGALGTILPQDPGEPVHVTICVGETRPFNGLVVSARPSGPHRVEVLAVIDAPEVYLADGTEVMPSPWSPPTLPPAVPLRPVVIGLNAALRAAPAALELDAMWQPAPGATSYVAEVSYDEGASWVGVYTGEANRFTVTVLPQALRLRVAAVGTVQGPWVTRIFVEGEVPDILIPGQMLEGQVDLSALDNQLAGVVGTIVNGREGSIASLLAAQEDRIERLAGAVARLTADGQGEAREFRRSLRAVRGQARALYDFVVTTVASELEAVSQTIESLGAAVGDVEAAVQAEQLARVAGDEAIALIANEAAVKGDLATAGGLFGIRAIVGPGGASVKLDAIGRITTEDDFAEVGWSGVINSDLSSYMMVIADKTYFTGSGVVKQVVTIDAVNEELILKSLRFEQIRSLDGETIFFDGVTGDFSLG